MNTLGIIFGSQLRVKILRLFLLNENTPFFLREILQRVKSNKDIVNKELHSLVRIELLKKKEFSKEVTVVNKDKEIVKKIKGKGYILNEKFPYRDLLKNLLTVASIHADDSLTKRLMSVGRIKLIVAAGIFIQNWDSRVDLLIVGDDLNLSKIEGIIRTIESEIGKEISYSAFETQDFEYRLGIHDRLVRDILDYSHVTLLDRLGIEPEK